MSLPNFFKRTPKVCPTKLNEAVESAIETPKQLDRIEEKLKALEERLIKELKNGSCKIAS